MSKIDQDKKAHAMIPLYINMRMMTTATNLQALSARRDCAETAVTTLFFCGIIDKAEFKGINKKIDLLQERNTKRIQAEKMGIAA